VTKSFALQNHVVGLEPLSQDHSRELAAAAADGELWNLWYTSVPRPDAVAAYIEKALRAQASGSELPFAIRSASTGAVVGTTRYLHIEAPHRRVEIGSTWLARTVQGTTINPAAKLLLLEHAFSEWRFNRVEFLTHSRNAQSRAALRKLGATQEGILRQHQVLPDGSLRDSVMFSIISAEWPAVRDGIRSRIGEARS
jgi:RimJ/RimL family protein N-acetyltransferase